MKCEAAKVSLPAAAVARTKLHVLDTIAAMVSGSRLKPGALAYARPYEGTYIEVFYDRAAKTVGAETLPHRVLRLVVQPQHAMSPPSPAGQPEIENTSR